MFPLNKIRMNNIYGVQPRTPSNYPMYEEFLNSIVPVLDMAEAQRRKEKVSEQRAAEDMFALEAQEKEKDRVAQQRGRLAEIAAQTQQQQQPMGTQFEYYMDPIKMRALDIQEQKNLINQELGLEKIASQKEIAEQRVGLGREGLRSKEEIAALKNKSSAEIATARNALQEKLQEMRGDQSIEAINRKGEIDAQLKELDAAYNIALEKEKGKIQQEGEWDTYVVDDPANPGQKKLVRVNPNTRKVEDYTGKETGTAGITKVPSGEEGGVGGKQAANLEAIRTKTQETLSALDDLTNEFGKLKPDVAQSVGGSRVFQLHRIAGTGARTGETAIKKAKASLLVDLIGEMKAQSRTGATGFGQLNLRELGVLENAASAVLNDPYVKDETFETEIAKIKERLKKILQDPSPTYTNKPKGGGTTGKPNADDLLKKYGGG